MHTHAIACLSVKFSRRPPPCSELRCECVSRPWTPASVSCGLIVNNVSIRRHARMCMCTHARTHAPPNLGASIPWQGVARSLSVSRPFLCSIMSEIMPKREQPLALLRVSCRVSRFVLSLFCTFFFSAYSGVSLSPRTSKREKKRKDTPTRIRRIPHLSVIERGWFDSGSCLSNAKIAINSMYHRLRITRGQMSS